MEPVAERQMTWSMPSNDVKRRIYVDSGVEQLHGPADVQATRTHDDVELGASPRATLGLLPLLAGVRRHPADAEYVTPDDVKVIAPYALSHRTILTPQARLRGRTAEDVVQELLSKVEVPV